jgi:hypothetical protein
LFIDTFLCAAFTAAALCRDYAKSSTARKKSSSISSFDFETMSLVESLKKAER